MKLYNHLCWYAVQQSYNQSINNIKPHGFTRSSDYLALLCLPLKFPTTLFNNLLPTLWNNLPPSVKTFANTILNLSENGSTCSLSLSLSKTQFCSQLKT